MEDKKESRISKLFSVKFWVTIWAMVMISAIVFTKNEAFKSIAEWLCAVPLAYIGANVIQKKIMTDAETTGDETK